MKNESNPKKGGDPTSPSLFDELARNITDMQRLWVDYYLESMNGAKAALKAGYSPTSYRTSASRNLRDPKVRAYLNARLNEMAMGAEEVLARLTDIARGDLGDFLSIGSRGKVEIDLKKAEELGKLHLIKTYTVTRRGTRLELLSQLDALNTLAKVHGLLIDRQDITTGGQPIGDSVYDRVMARVSQRLESLPASDSEADTNQPLTG